MSLGETLRRLRKSGPRGDVGATQVEREHGLNRQTLYLWEGRKSRPDPVELREYLEWLGCTSTQISHVLYLRSLPLDATEDDVPTLPDDSPTLADDGPTHPGEAA